MANYTLSTTEAQEAILAWYMTQLHGETIPLAAVITWMQAELDATIDGLAGQKLSMDVQALMNAYREKTPEEQEALLPQLQALLGIDW
jgi:hypothetical protein